MSQEVVKRPMPRNPSTGLPFRNPSHEREADNAVDQKGIVESMSDFGVKQISVTYDYADYDEKDPPPLVGITKIKDMSPEDIKGLCKSILRCKPNIFGLHIKLGNYSRQRKLVTQKTNLLTSNQPRHPSEIGEKLADILSDPASNVTEVFYTVQSNEPGYFSAVGEVFATDEEQWNDEELFAPRIEITFIKTT